MRGVAKTGERRIRGGVIWAELASKELERFIAECTRRRRTTGYLGGRIIADWLKTRAAEEMKRTNT